MTVVFWRCSSNSPEPIGQKEPTGASLLPFDMAEELRVRAEAETHIPQVHPAPDGFVWVNINSHREDFLRGGLLLLKMLLLQKENIFPHPSSPATPHPPIFIPWGKSQYLKHKRLDRWCGVVAPSLSPSC